MILRHYTKGYLTTGGRTEGASGAAGVSHSMADASSSAPSQSVTPVVGITRAAEEAAKFAAPKLTPTAELAR